MAANNLPIRDGSVIFVRYMQCFYNHAAHLNRFAFDGCQEFIAAGEVGTPEALICGACGCYRGFHQIFEFQVPAPPPLPPHENPEIQMPAEPVVELQFAEDAPNSPPPVEESSEEESNVGDLEEGSFNN